MKSHRGLLILALIAIVTIAVLAVFLWRPSAPQTAAATAVTLHPQSPPTAPISSPASPGVQSVSSGDTPVAAKSDNFCGASAADQRRLPSESFGHHLMRTTEPTLTRWKQTLRASASARLQALALALDTLTPDPDGEVFIGSRNVPSELLRPIAQSSDPIVYALGLSACGGLGFPTPTDRCPGLSIQHWTELDPESPVPWLWRTAEAQSLGTMPDAEEAMRRASTAPRVSNELWQLAQEAYSLLPTDADALDRIVAEEELIGIVPTSGLSMQVIQCMENQLTDPSRRTLCETLATHLAPLASGLESVYGAPELYRRLGRPAADVNRLQQSAKPWRLALGNVENDEAAPKDSYGCERALPRAAAIDQLFSPNR